MNCVSRIRSITLSENVIGDFLQIFGWLKHRPINNEFGLVILAADVILYFQFHVQRGFLVFVLEGFSCKCYPVISKLTEIYSRCKKITERRCRKISRTVDKIEFLIRIIGNFQIYEIANSLSHRIFAIVQLLGVYGNVPE